MKNARSFSFFDICQPGGNGPSSSDALATAEVRETATGLATAFGRALVASTSSI